MPSSLVVTALIVAWLVVLVPVVARRRQLVPRPAEADLCSRVLRRSGGPASMEVVVSGNTSPARSLRGGGGTAVADRVDRADRAVEPEIADELDELDEYSGLDEHSGLDDRDDDSDEDGDETGPAAAGPSSRRPFRPGRGGFDPEAAIAAADARYAFRRRVAVGLIAVAVLSAVAALAIASAFWWLHVLTDVVLVAYLVFLRRQTRIEEEIRERRLARLTGERRALEARRARQADHDRRLADTDEWGAWDGEHEDDGYYDDEDGEVLGLEDDELVVAAEASPRSTSPRSTSPRWAAPRTPARPLPEGLELVEDSVDDPAFHDLDADRVPAYRRAAGA